MATTSATSASLALSGLASGLDWTSIVNELLTVERAPETQMKAEQTTLQSKDTAYQGVGTQLTTLENDVTTLSNPDFFDTRTTSVSDPSVLTATAASAAPLGTYSFDVKQMASDAVQQGATANAKALSPTNNVSTLVLNTAGFATPVTGGTFTVNGQTVTIATSDTLQSVFDKISTATGNAVTGSYNATTDEISLNSTSPIVLGSATDSSNFLQATQLYNNGTGIVTSASSLGGVNLSTSLGSANLSTTITDGGSGAGEFMINGVAISFNSSTDAMTDVLQRINDSGAGVTATYDSVNDRFQLTNKTTGDVGISLQDVTGNFLAATGLSSGTLQRGTNLQYTINNGGVLTSQNNTIDGTSAGVAGLSVTATGIGTTNVTINSDTSTISAAISSFVTDYNATQSYITSQITPTPDSSANGGITPAVLTGDLDTEDIASQLRQITNTPVNGLSGTLKSLTDMGIISNGNDNSIQLLSPAIVSSNLATNLSSVKALFSDPTNGIAAKLNTYLTSLTSSTGVLANDENNMTKQSTDITASIASLEARVTQDGNRLTAEFVAMETAINTINTQKQFLNNSFGASTASSQAAPVAAGSSSTG